MKSLKKKRRVQVIAICAVALVISTGLMGYAMRDGISFFRSPTEVAAEPPEASEVFRLGGLVLEGSITPIDGNQFDFVISDRDHSVTVKYVGDQLPPDLFGEGQGTIATGSYKDGTFYATELLAKHDEDYMPQEVVDLLKEQGLYKPDGS